MELWGDAKENKQEQTFLHLKLWISAVELSLRYGKWEEKLTGKNGLKTFGVLQGTSLGKAQHKHEGLMSDPYHPHKKAAMAMPGLGTEDGRIMRVCRLAALTKTSLSSSVRGLVSKVAKGRRHPNVNCCLPRVPTWMSLPICKCTYTDNHTSMHIRAYAQSYSH